MKKAWLLLVASVWLIPMLYMLLFSFFASIPYPHLLPQGFRLDFWAEALTRNPLLLGSLFTSLQLGVLTGAATTFLGFMTAKGLSCLPTHHAYYWFALLSLPLFIPAMVLVMGLHLLMLQLTMANTLPAILLAHVSISLPYATAIFLAYLRGIGTSMEEVARTLGCSSLYYYRKLLLPLLLPAFFFSFSIGFLLSFSDLFAVQLLGGGNIISFSMLMVPAISNSHWGSGAVMGSLFMAVHLVLFFLADRLLRRGLPLSDYFF